MDGEHVEPVTPDEVKAFTERILRCLNSVLDADAVIGYLLVSGLRVVDSAATPDDDVERREEYEADFVVRLTELDALLRQIRQPEIERLVETIKLAPNRPQPPPDLVHGEFFPTDRTTYCEAGIRLAGAYLFACKFLCRAWEIDVGDKLVDPTPPPMPSLNAPDGLGPHWRYLHEQRLTASSSIQIIRAGVDEEFLAAKQHTTVLPPNGNREPSPESPQPVAPPDMKKNERRMFDYLRENPNATFDDIEDQLDMGRATISKYFKRFQEIGLVAKRPNGGWSLVERYRQPPPRSKEK